MPTTPESFSSTATASLFLNTQRYSDAGLWIFNPTAAGVNIAGWTFIGNQLVQLCNNYNLGAFSGIQIALSNSGFPSTANVQLVPALGTFTGFQFLGPLLFWQAGALVDWYFTGVRR